KIRSLAPLHDDVSNLLAHVNQLMYELMSEEGFFATIILGRYWPGTGKVQLARAGHPYPLWVADHRVRDLPQIDGIPLGVESGSRYKRKEFSLSPGEALLFFSDGVPEAENKKNELFGDDRLTAYFVMANGPPWAEGLLNRIDSWRRNAAMNDDLTLLEIWRDP
ncbi:MAG: PP2C family protein-serine/threonine phosphatase, partial [Desulfobacterales bacterium]